MVYVPPAMRRLPLVALLLVAPLAWAELPQMLEDTEAGLKKALQDRGTTVNAVVEALAPAVLAKGPDALSAEEAARFSKAWLDMAAAARAVAGFYGANAAAFEKERSGFKEQLTRLRQTELGRRQFDQSVKKVGLNRASGLMVQQFIAHQRKVLEGEAQEDLKALRNYELSFFAEWNTYSGDFQKLGYQPEPCADGTRAAVPDGSWIAGCHFVYQLVLTGAPGSPSAFQGNAVGVAGLVKGVRYHVGSGDDAQPVRE